MNYTKKEITLYRLEQLNGLANTLFNAYNFQERKSIAEDPFNGTIWQIKQLAETLLYEEKLKYEEEEKRIMEERKKYD